MSQSTLLSIHLAILWLRKQWCCKGNDVYAVKWWAVWEKLCSFFASCSWQSRHSSLWLQTPLCRCQQGETCLTEEKVTWSRLLIGYVPNTSVELMNTHNELTERYRNMRGEQNRKKVIFFVLSSTIQMYSTKKLVHIYLSDTNLQNVHCGTN